MHKFFSLVKNIIKKNDRETKTLDLQECANEIAHVGLTTPYRHFVEGEDLVLQFLPAIPGHYEAHLTGTHGLNRTIQLTDNKWIIKGGLKTGNYKIKVRWRPILKDSNMHHWTRWSLPLELAYYPVEERQKVDELSVFEHRLSLIVDKDINGTYTITDPFALPPGCPEDEAVRWFRTPCYEGSTMLINEEADYYRHPMVYYLDNILRLKQKGVIFRTWHEILDGKYGTRNLEIILQFDVDGGPRSMEKLYHELSSMGVRANIMIHRKCHDWYSYTIDDLNIDFLKEAEQRGWNIGYHNNSISNVQRLDRMGDYSYEVLNQAKEYFMQDVCYLRQWFNIKTFTHHGGNAYNNRTPTPSDLDIVCVDKQFNKLLWKPIESSFSDGGFISRPCSLREKVDNLKPGLHFFRNHPFKYANYTTPFDAPPLLREDAEKAGYVDFRGLIEQITCERKKQSLWLELRDKYVTTHRLSYASIEKPISQKFRPFSEIHELVKNFRSLRSLNFSREYPWTQGDPRVFWWRMLDSFAPKEGVLINVEGLPPDQRDETTVFVASNVRVLDVDIDPAEQPHILCDITNPPPELYNQFTGTSLFELSYFHSPSKVIESCA